MFSGLAKAVTPRHGENKGMVDSELRREAPTIGCFTVDVGDGVNSVPKSVLLNIYLCYLLLYSFSIANLADRFRSFN